MDQDGLHQLEEQCIQEHTPACSATCPARVDVRGICSEIEKSDFPAALKLLRKTIPFPGIISRICDEPCRSACVRKNAGESVAIAQLERSCVEFGGPPASLPYIPKRDNYLAVIGGGLFGLTAACDLAKKGYEITIFEKKDNIGGAIRSISDEVLPEEIIENDFKFIVDLGIHIEKNCTVQQVVQIEPGKFGIHGQLFDAVLLSIGSKPDNFLKLEMDKTGILIDPVSYETNLPGVFSGGKSASYRDGTIHGNMNSPIYILADGHRVATSIDRFFQHVSLTASRIKEGSYETRLFTSVEGIPVLPAVVPAGQTYSREEAISEARRCLKCQCLECVKVCEYLNEYGSYPKRYLREIYNNLSIVKGERRKNQFINSCSLCGLCGVVCPTDLDMGSVCLESRRTMVAQNRMPPSAHDFALRDMQFSNSEKISLIRNEPGTVGSKYLFFPGCQLCASNPDYVEKIYGILRNIPDLTNKGGIGLALRCCGAPARWAGRTELFEETKTEFLEEYKKLGSPEIIVACSSCFQVFKEDYPEIPIISLWTLMEEVKDLIPGQGIGNGITVSIHDPCTTRMESEIHTSIRRIVEKMEFEIEELPLSREKTECCSYGGLMWLANKPLASKVVERRINENQNPYITYCVMCRDFFNKQGKTTYHVLDLIFNTSVDDLKYTPPDYSQRHRNRETLKYRLLKELWGEEMEPSKEKSYSLHIPPEVRSILEDRLILEEDIQKVLAHAVETGQYLENPKNHHFLASFCPAYVTYWVEYSILENVYTIHNAYSHRMTIDEAKRHE